MTTGLQGGESQMQPSASSKKLHNSTADGNFAFVCPAPIRQVPYQGAGVVVAQIQSESAQLFTILGSARLNFA
jgi:hypothetical protein